MSRCSTGWMGRWRVFLARHAGNYFAKVLLPTAPRNGSLLSERNITPSRICLQCWYDCNDIQLEDEAHVLLHCPAYAKQRRDLLSDASGNLVDLITAAGTDDGKMRAIFSSHLKQDWESFSRFLARIRQACRKMKVVMAEMGVRRVEQSFEKQKEAWQYSGRFVCRHGVFFQSLSRISCPCMAPPSSADSDACTRCSSQDDRSRHFQRLRISAVGSPTRLVLPP